MKRIEEKVLMAIEKDEFQKLLDGSDGYAVIPGRFEGASVPTDWIPIIRKIHELHSHMPYGKIDCLFENALDCLCKGSAYQVYCAMMVFFIQIQFECDNSATFSIHREQILPQIKQGLLIHHDELAACKKWLGFGHEDGLWGEVRRVSRLLPKYGVNLGLHDFT